MESDDMENKQQDIIPVEAQTFDEDDFDLLEHKKAANTVAQAKAHAKSVRRKVAVGRVIIMVAAIAVCGLLWFMVSMIVGLL